MTTLRKIPSQSVLLELLSYDPETGHLKWKPRDRRLFNSDRTHMLWNARNAGKRAGNVRTNALGYSCRSVGVNYVTYLEHRIVWMMVTGQQPPSEIDHIDQDATNNKFSNLRESNTRANKKNVKRRRNNTSGITGVSKSAQTGRWRGCVVVDKKQHSLGYFEHKEDAAAAVIEFRAKHGFSDRHGNAL